MSNGGNLDSVTSDGTVNTSNESTALAVIEEQAEAGIRRIWHDERWFFSIIDVIGLLTDAPKPRMYWADMKRRIQEEGFRELLAKCQQLKLESPDGKQRLTDVADTETVLRIIQSIPSPKAEPVKQWLARVGAQQLDIDAIPSATAVVEPFATHPAAPNEDAPALEWAAYHEQLAALYRRQARYEAQLADLDAWRGHVEGRLEAHEASLALLPEILERLGPETLSPEHQRSVQQSVKRLHDAGGASFGAIYADLLDHCHVAKYDQLSEARWPEVAAWFTTRIEAAARRHARP